MSGIANDYQEKDSIHFHKVIPRENVKNHSNIFKHYVHLPPK